MTGTTTSNGTSANDAQSKLDNRTVPPLGMTGPQFLEAATSTINEIERYYSHISERPVLPSVQPGYLPQLLPETAPEIGEQWSDIQQDIERTIMPGITHWQHPKFMAYFPASSTYPGMLGEMWSAALTAPAFNWICSPAITELETVVLDWLAKIIALPESFLSKGHGGGVIQGSASEAIVTVMVAARERFVRRQIEREGLTDAEQIEDRACELRGKLVALASDQAHSSSQKAATIAGTRFRSIATRHGEAYALQGRDLRAKIDELHARGLQPYYLTVSIGATGVCAVDDFDSIAAVARDHPDIWIHCDAAYAGAALVLPAHQHLSQHMSFVDSFNFNMHKWLLTNFDASCLYVQQRRDLTDALSITPAYLKNEYTASGLVTDYRDWQIPLGRRFRALKIWFVLRTWGVRGLQAHIQHHIDLGNLFASLVRSRPDLFRILAPPAFALTVITVHPPPSLQQQQQRHPSISQSSATGTDPRPEQDQVDPKLRLVNDPTTTTTTTTDDSAGNSTTKQVFELIDARKEWFLTSTLVAGVYAIRIVSANPLAEEKYVRQVFDELVRTAEDVRSQQTSREG